MAFADSMLIELVAGLSCLSPRELEGLLEVVDQMGGDSPPSAEHQGGDSNCPALLAKLLSESGMLGHFFAMFVQDAGVGSVAYFKQMEAEAFFLTQCPTGIRCDGFFAVVGQVLNGGGAREEDHVWARGRGGMQPLRDGFAMHPIRKVFGRGDIHGYHSYIKGAVMESFVEDKPRLIVTGDVVGVEKRVGASREEVCVAVRRVTERAVSRWGLFAPVGMLVGPKQVPVVFPGIKLLSKRDLRRCPPVEGVRQV